MDFSMKDFDMVNGAAVNVQHKKQFDAAIADVELNAMKLMVIVAKIANFSIFFLFVFIVSIRRRKLL